MVKLKDNIVFKFINKCKKLIDYTLYGLVFLCLFISCFVESFVYVSAVIICLSSIFFFFDMQKNLGLIFIINCFSIVLETSSISIFKYLDLFVCFVTCLSYLVSVIKGQKKLNFKLLIPVVIFLIYVILPIHKVSLVKAVNIIKIYGFMYVVYECRKEISAVYLIKFFSASILIACFYALFRGVSVRLDSIMPYVSDHKYLRFSALFVHPNSFAVYCAVVISGLLFLRYKNKVSLPLFFVLFIPLFCFGLTSISRNFCLVVAVALFLFAIFHIFKTKKNFWKFGLTLFLAVVLCCGMCFTETKIMLVRFKVLPEESISDFVENSDVGSTITTPGKGDGKELGMFSDEWWEALFNGEISYDPGRKGIIKNYLMAWRQSVKSMLFGKGIDAPQVGVYHAHNMFVQELYTHGIVGMLFYLTFILCIINFKRLKYWKKYIPMILLLVPYFVMVMFEAQMYDFESFIIFTLALGLIENEIIKETNKTKKKILYYSDVNLEEQNTNITSLIENCDSEKYSFDLVTTNQDVSTKNIEILNNKGCSVYNLKENKFIKIINFIKFVMAKGELYDVVHINANSRGEGIIAYIAKDFGYIENVIFHSHKNSEDKNKVLDYFGLVFIKNFSNNLVASSINAGQLMYGKKYFEKHNVLVLDNIVKEDKPKVIKQKIEEMEKLYDSKKVIKNNA